MQFVKACFSESEWEVLLGDSQFVSSLEGAADTLDSAELIVGLGDEVIKKHHGGSDYTLKPASQRWPAQKLLMWTDSVITEAPYVAA
jgi:hypothetical protein